MYLEEEMQTTAAERWRDYLCNRVDHILTEQQKMSERLSALEGEARNPLGGFEEEDRAAKGWVSAEAYQQLGARFSDLKKRASELEEEVGRLQRRLTMMQAGYNAISTIQARLDANEREMGGHRCSKIATPGTGQRGSL